jgi:lipopolysaccharide/colanic/teichoic acid biosynthesis glycosyltransferase
VLRPLGQIPIAGQATLAGTVATDTAGRSGATSPPVDNTATEAVDEAQAGGPTCRVRRVRTSRVLDVAVALPVLVLASPVILGLALLIRFRMGSPILFRQERAGRGGEVFELVKFRTMRPTAPGDDGPDSDRQRLTPLGRVLRSTSLDELPTLLNVIRGNMSLVGPRPLPVRYLARYSPEHARRHEVRPGITGWAQANGRNALSWDQQLDMDVWYVDHKSLRLDLRILRDTVASVARRQGISAESHATRPEFPGSGASQAGLVGQEAGGTS